jgi:hypothetical protein
MLGLRPATWRDVLGGLIVAAIVLAAGAMGPTNQVGADPRFTLVIAESILLHGDASLTRYFPAPPYPYQVVPAEGGHAVSFYPLGSSVVMIPYVILTRALGWPVVREDQSLNLELDNRLQIVAASLLMAGAAFLFFLAAQRRGLSAMLSGAVALVGVLGTPMFSSGARALWADATGAFLLTAALFFQMGLPRRVPAVAWATALSACVLMKPPYLLTAAALFGVEAWRRPRAIWLPGLVALAWGALFYVLLRLLLPAKALPYYGLIDWLSWKNSLQGFAGILISPSRGLLVFVPLTLPLAWRLVATRRELPDRLFVLGMLLAIGFQTALLSVWPLWWGGFSYGPRLMLGVMPLLIFLAMEALAARPLSRWERPVWIVLAMLSVGLHLRGGWDARTWDWNWLHPDEPEILWEWRYPQFLAGLIDRPPPANPPPLEGRDLPIGANASRKSLWKGWSGWEGSFRWTEAPRAEMVLGPISFPARTLRMGGFAFLVPDKLTSQRVRVFWNGEPLGERTIAGAFYEVWTLPPGALDGPRHRLTLELPDATSPQSVGFNDDTRELGLGVQSLRLEE